MRDQVLVALNSKMIPPCDDRRGRDVRRGRQPRGGRASRPGRDEARRNCRRNMIAGALERHLCNQLCHRVYRVYTGSIQGVCRIREGVIAIRCHPQCGQLGEVVGSSDDGKHVIRQTDGSCHCRIMCRSLWYGTGALALATCLSIVPNPAPPKTLLGPACVTSPFFHPLSHKKIPHHHHLLLGWRQCLSQANMSSIKWVASIHSCPLWSRYAPPQNSSGQHWPIPRSVLVPKIFSSPAPS